MQRPHAIRIRNVILSGLLACEPLSRCEAQAVLAGSPEDGQGVEATFKAMLEEPSEARYFLIRGFLAELPPSDFQKFMRRSDDLRKCRFQQIWICC